MTEKIYIFIYFIPLFVVYIFAVPLLTSKDRLLHSNIELVQYKLAVIVAASLLHRCGCLTNLRISEFTETNKSMIKACQRQHRFICI